MDAITTSDAWILAAIPLAAFFAIALFHNFLWRQGDWIGVLSILVVFVLVLAVVSNGLQDYPNNLPGVKSWEWMSVGDYELRIGFYVDQIAMVMLIVVTTVALMVNVYSLGYMQGEPRYGWFFAVLALFAFSMLTLVMADSLLFLFIAWELVGVCSYFLIGFYYERRSAVEAAKKAFVVNRIGDVGLLIGIILFWKATGTFNIQAIIEAVENGEIGSTYLMIAAFFLLLGPIAKSAQVPLHVWLPDAMEGPTPVSALIHAATMVVAGIYLVARMLPVFEAARYVPETIMALGMITALLGATVALTQSDLKRVIAYSTISNLGFMMLSLGAGALTAAMFHLMTHAFFKACLFLGAGSVIHSTGHQEMDRLGGLRKYMPITFITFLVAALANAGILPLAGFWSKDEMLFALQDNHVIYFVIALGWVVISGAYTGRMLKYTFWGEYKGLEEPLRGHEADPDVVEQALHHAQPEPAITAAAARGLGAAHVIEPDADEEHQAREVAAHGGHGHHGEPHESPWSMTIPLIILGLLSIGAGFVTIPEVGEAIGLPGGFGALVFSTLHGPEEFHFDWILAITGTVAAVGGLLFALYIVARPSRVRRFTAAFPELYNFAVHKFYFDELYQSIIDRIILAFARVIAWFDRKVINDTGVDGPSLLTKYIGYRLKFTQTGRLPNYALIIILGVLVLAALAYTTRT
ncbi:MAG: NADH-quinone oxidoreductase subunit L [Dehalococcoidia bacterium]